MRIWLVALSLGLTLFGCSCQEQGHPYVVLDGAVPDREMNDASLPDATLPDATLDAAKIDAGLGDPCRDATECASGLCTGDTTSPGVCCDQEDNLCGAECCLGGDLCFGGACVTPGDSCLLERDCGEEAYCEFALGSGNTGNDSCSALADGLCLPLPPSCADVAPGTPCVAEPGACEFRPVVEDLDAVVQWFWDDTNATLPEYVDVWSTPMVGRVADTDCDDDVDRDDVPSIVFVSGELLTDDDDPLSGAWCGSAGQPAGVCQDGVLRILAGDDGRELLTLEALEGSVGFLGHTVALADMSNDGVLDIVLLTAERLVTVLDGKGAVLMQSDVPALPAANNVGWGGGPAVADIDQDGFAEVTFGGSVFSSKTGDLELIWQAGVTPERDKSLEFFADVAPTPGLELVTSQALYDAQGNTLWDRSMDIEFGFPAVADLDKNGSPEIVVVSKGLVYVLDPLDDGKDVLPPFTLGNAGDGGPPTIADFDGDTFPEIGVAQQEAYYMIKPNFTDRILKEVWAAPNHDKSSSVTGSTVFDFQGDGAAEVIYNDECYLWVYDGKTGDVRFATPTKSFTATESNVVADVDADGHAEMLWVANRVSPDSWNCEDDGWTEADPVTKRPAWTRPADDGMWRGVRVYRDRANSWVGTRQIWNQHAYSVTNICTGEDSACGAGASYGEVPREQLSNWSQPWANNFRQNIQESGVFDAADALVDVLVDCAPNPNVTVLLRNQGRVPLPEGVAVEVFEKVGDTETLLETIISDQSVYPGRVLEFTVVAGPPQLSSTYFARISDENTRFVECDLTNNISEAKERSGCGLR